MESLEDVEAPFERPGGAAYATSKALVVMTRAAESNFNDGVCLVQLYAVLAPTGKLHATSLAGSRSGSDDGIQRGAAGLVLDQLDVVRVTVKRFRVHLAPIE